LQRLPAPSTVAPTSIRSDVSSSCPHNITTCHHASHHDTRSQSFTKLRCLQPVAQLLQLSVPRSSTVAPTSTCSDNLRIPSSCHTTTSQRATTWRPSHHGAAFAVVHSNQRCLRQVAQLLQQRSSTVAPTSICSDGRRVPLFMSTHNNIHVLCIIMTSARQSFHSHKRVHRPHEHTHNCRSEMEREPPVADAGRRQGEDCAEGQQGEVAFAQPR
jgi:hypothetical protein